MVLVRHGETTPNRQGLLLGRADPPLTDRGRRQADELAVQLGALQPVAVFTSPLARARDTAAPIAAAAGCDAEVDDRLIEALGVGDELAWRMRLDVASVTRIGPGPVLLSFNERVR
jgi:broad specificity phosphatase PhoE